MSDGTFGHNPQLPKAIREIFKELCQEAASIHLLWDFYLELFGDEETAQLLNDYARASFVIIEQSVRNDIATALCRLSDPAKTGGFENLSLATLSENCGHIPEINRLINEFRTECKPIEQYRNKLVAHRDLATTIKPRENPIPGISRTQIERILVLIRDILNAVNQYYVEAGLGFKVFAYGGADALIHALKLAKKEREDELRKLYGDKPT